MWLPALALLFFTTQSLIVEKPKLACFFVDMVCVFVSAPKVQIWLILSGTKHLSRMFILILLYNLMLLLLQ